MNQSLSLFSPARDAAIREYFDQGSTTRQWVPRIDLVETGTEYQVTAELPGINKEHVKVTCENNVLNISGEKIDERDLKETSSLKVERRYGKFNRSISLGNDVESDKIEAMFKNGLLMIKVPKKKETQIKIIEIK